jgi:hypothetical protein
VPLRHRVLGAVQTIADELAEIRKACLAVHNFSKALAVDPYYPYEETKDWIWYKSAEE